MSSKAFKEASYKRYLKSSFREQFEDKATGICLARERRGGKLLFLTLNVFSVTGGIEKVCRILAKALTETAREWQQDFQVFSSHDHSISTNNRYFPSQAFRAFKANKFRFVCESVKKGIACRLIILSHVNLLPVGYLIKLLSPKTKLVLIAHGIEVWRPLAGWKKVMLHKVDLILCVSRFTKDKMKQVHRLREEKFTVLNNPLDPFLPAAPSAVTTTALREKYGFTASDFVMLTLTRLSGTEKNKGYDKVLFAMVELRKQYTQLRYLLVGKYDKDEKNRLDELIAGYGLTGLVVFAGFVPDADLAVHYSIANLYVMPSEKEGFGISFIEALYYGVPVIAGNRDGTTDALLNGQLGTLVDPRNQQDITGAIKKVVKDTQTFIPNRELLMKKFSYETYKSRLQDIVGRGN